MAEIAKTIFGALARHHNKIVAGRLGGIGLKIHDAIAETSDDITHATTRLPHDLQEARYRRMIRASDILVKRKFFHAKERAEVNVIDPYLTEPINLVNHEWNERKVLRGW